jgi:DNA recombination protein RmuC
MTISAMLLALLILFVGIVGGSIIATGRARRSSEKQLRESEAAKATLQGAGVELRIQIESMRGELDRARLRIDEEVSRNASAETALAKTEENIREQKKILEEAQSKLSDVFRSLAAETLSDSNRQFLELASTKLEGLQNEATGELDKRRIAIDALVLPLSETLRDLKTELARVENSRTEAYGQLTNQLRSLDETSKELRDETGSLVSSLRQPQVKGKWGELTLRRAVELAGLSPHCDFIEQPSVATEDGRLRPDLIVKLAGGRQIVVDAKVPLHAFLKAVSADESTRVQAMIEHVQLVRNHISQLATKAYWNQFEQTPEMVVLFMPAESFFSAALEQDRDLIEDAMSRRVLLASPTTLIALLRSIAYGWRQEQVEENAQRISALGKDLYEKVLKFSEHIEDIRTGLERANKAYNNAVGSLESRLLPAARRFREMGVQTTMEIPSAAQTETSLRTLPPTSSDPVI